MQQIDERRLESDLLYRVWYLKQFMGFGDKDVQAIHGSAAFLAPLVPALVDAVYDKLFQRRNQTALSAATARIRRAYSREPRIAFT